MAGPDGRNRAVAGALRWRQAAGEEGDPIGREPIGRGERAPDFVLPRGGSGDRARFYGFVGGVPAVLLLTGEAVEAGRGLATTLREELPEGVDVHLVTCGRPPGEDFHDPDGRVHQAYGVATDGPPTAVVLDANVRVHSVHPAGDPAGPTRAVAAAAEALLDAGGPARAPRHPPVLLIPRALEPALCQRLIGVWEAAAPTETGVETTADGRRTEALDALRKRRRDHVVTDPDLLERLTAHVGRRVMPEVRKAFAYRATRFEGFKIGCYTADDGGFFEAHRDNLSPSTAHRRFALTLNLNDGYAGGELCFPEYGRLLYRPDAGEALVFSGAHLHQVRPVTRGRRFVLLSFLFSGEPGPA